MSLDKWIGDAAIAFRKTAPKELFDSPACLAYLAGIYGLAIQIVKDTASEAHEDAGPIMTFLTTVRESAINTFMLTQKEGAEGEAKGVFLNLMDFVQKTVMETQTGADQVEAMVNLQALRDKAETGFFEKRGDE